MIIWGFYIKSEELLFQDFYPNLSATTILRAPDALTLQSNLQ